MKYPPVAICLCNLPFSRYCWSEYTVEKLDQRAGLPCPKTALEATWTTGRHRLYPRDREWFLPASAGGTA